MTLSLTEPELVVGIDPSLRHTGLALDRRGQLPVYHEIKTGTVPVVEAIRTIRSELLSWLQLASPERSSVIWALEQQMAQADVNGWLMMLVQCAVCEVIRDWTLGKVRMVAPYPNQLKAYIRRMHGVDTATKTQIRYGQRKILVGRGQPHPIRLVSSHKAEAWFLTQMARDVLAGRWSYVQSPVKVRVFPWPIIRGATV